MGKDIQDKKDIVYDTILSRRSIRRFKQKEIPLNILEKLVNAARVAPSGANLQVLEYVIINEKELCKKIFETIGWAAYIKPSWTPNPNERPVAYIVVMLNDPNNRWYQRDVGFASENIAITAEAEKIGSCILCNINKNKIKEIINALGNLQVDSLIALGYIAEKSVIENMVDSVKYWRDEKEIFHVPKRKLEDIIHYNKFK